MIVPFEQLKEQLGGTTIEDVIVRLDKQKIKFLTGKHGRPFTTEFAMNHAMGLVSDAKSNPSRESTIEIM